MALDIFRPAVTLHFEHSLAILEKFICLLGVASEMKGRGKE